MSFILTAKTLILVPFILFISITSLSL